MIQLRFDQLHCEKDTTEAFSDEPYVLVLAVDLEASLTVPGVMINVPSTVINVLGVNKELPAFEAKSPDLRLNLLPGFEVFLYGPFEGVSTAETHQAPGNGPSFWSIGSMDKALEHPDKAIFLVVLMENDYGKPEALRAIVKGAAAGIIFETLGASRTGTVNALIKKIDSVLGTRTTLLDSDEVIAEVADPPNYLKQSKVSATKELKFSQAELQLAKAGTKMSKTLEFKGEGARYLLTFSAQSPR